MTNLYEFFKILKFLTDRSFIRRCYITADNERYCTDRGEMYLLKEAE